MKLVASMIVKNELSRYLSWTVPALLEFCDEVAVLDDGSDDGSFEWLQGVEGVRVIWHTGLPAFTDEGKARQRLLDWTLESEPTHILAIDADELVADGATLRQAIYQEPNVNVWTLLMQEVWEAYDECLCIRTDGGWHPHPSPCLYRVPVNHSAEPLFRIADRALACGREPTLVRRLSGYAPSCGTEILHLGWANQAERQARYDRYTVADGGRFHTSAHLESILWGSDRVELAGRPWPTHANKAGLHARVSLEGAPA